MTDRDTGRSRGFGFVEMASAEDGEKAIAALNGQEIVLTLLNINEARPKTERGPGGGGGGRIRGRGGYGGGRGGHGGGGGGGGRGGRGGGGGGGRGRQRPLVIFLSHAARHHVGRLMQCKLEARAPVAQLDRAVASGATGREFESLRAHQQFPLLESPQKSFFIHLYL